MATLSTKRILAAITGTSSRIIIVWGIRALLFIPAIGKESMILARRRPAAWGDRATPKVATLRIDETTGFRAGDIAPHRARGDTSIRGKQHGYRQWGRSMKWLGEYFVLFGLLALGLVVMGAVVLVVLRLL